MKQIKEYAHYIASLAQSAILYEVSTTPKPGLVDRENQGAHMDMDFFTFMRSSAALYSGLYECVMEGLTFEEADNTKLLAKVRIPGMKCEEKMFEATNGVNTHKGIIFSLGIICAVVGKLYRQYGKSVLIIEEICEEVKRVTKGITVREFKDINNKKMLTHGERVFLEYGYTGIRGEVESGFKNVQKNAIPIIRGWNNVRKLSKNDMFLQVLMSIMTENNDTNVIIRGGIESLTFIKDISRDFLKSGGMYQPNAKEKLQEMNAIFVGNNISPGGSADLLAVSVFFGMLEGIIK